MTLLSEKLVLEIVSSIKPESDLISILIYKGLISHKAFIVTVGYELAIQRGSKPKGAASRPTKPNGQQLAIGRYPSMLAIKDLLADLILLTFRIIIKNNSNENTPLEDNSTSTESSATKATASL